MKVVLHLQTLVAFHTGSRDGIYLPLTHCFRLSSTPPRRKFFCHCSCSAHHARCLTHISTCTTLQRVYHRAEWRARLMLSQRTPAAAPYARKATGQWPAGLQRSVHSYCPPVQGSTGGFLAASLAKGSGSRVRIDERRVRTIISELPYPAQCPRRLPRHLQITEQQIGELGYRSKWYSIAGAPNVRSGQRNARSAPASLVCALRDAPRGALWANASGSRDLEHSTRERMTRALDRSLVRRGTRFAPRRKSHPMYTTQGNAPHRPPGALMSGQFLARRAVG